MIWDICSWTFPVTSQWFSWKFTKNLVSEHFVLGPFCIQIDRSVSFATEHKFWIAIDSCEKFLKNLISEHFIQVINVSDMVLAGYPEPARLERTIRHVRATAEGHIHLDLVDWPHFSYTGRSVLKLRDELWLRQGIFNVPGIRLCVRAACMRFLSRWWPTCHITLIPWTSSFTTPDHLVRELCTFLIGVLVIWLSPFQHVLWGA